MSDNDEIISVRLTGDLARHVRSKSNQSEYIRKLIKADLKGPDTDLVGIQAQIDTLEEGLEPLQRQVQAKQQRIEDLKALRDDYKQENEIALSAALDALDGAPPEPTNPGIQRWAEKLDLTPQELARRVEEERNNTAL